MSSKNDNTYHLILDDIKEIKTSVKEITDTMHKMNVVAAQQHGSLVEHMRRTEANEKMVENIVNRVVPLEKHVAMWAGASKVIVIIGVIVSIAGGIYKILSAT